MTEKITLSDEQRRILCVCVCCQAPVDEKSAGDALQSGQVRPGTLMCRECASDSEHAAEKIITLGTVTAAAMARERTIEAGLVEEFDQLARQAINEAAMRARNEQN